MKSIPSIKLHQVGIARVLRDNDLQVPLNQRDYAWGGREVVSLFQDIGRAIAAGEPEYFLGSIVTIPKGNYLEVVDGQQRLATTVVLLAAIRDYLRGREADNQIVVDIERMLVAIDRRARESRPRLRLNVTDAEFFRRLVFDADPSEVPSAKSHERIRDAVRLAREHVASIVAPINPKDHGDVLDQWLEFLENGAWVILLVVSDEANAYRMFETLNDRGLRTTQADLIKNHLFGETGQRIGEAQSKWTAMRAVLESVERREDTTVNFLRQMMISMHGYLREAQLYKAVEEKTRGATLAIQFLSTLAAGADDFAAIANPDHEKWRAYPHSVRTALDTLGIVRVRPMMPLFLSVAKHFSHKEADTAFRLLVSLATRLLIVGGSRTGSVEEGLARVAAGASRGAIRGAKELREALKDVAPSDLEFQQAFATVRAPNAKLARYYLRSLERTHKAEPDPYFVLNESPAEINLEHVLPRSPEENWPEFSDEEAHASYARLGNLALLRAKNNYALLSDPFAKKRVQYATSPYELTAQIGRLEGWSPEAIERRQKVLAELAIRTWPWEGPDAFGGP